MNNNKYQKLKNIIIIGLPVWTILLVNIAAAAHFKNFCLIKLLFHHECWGCGLTRALAAFSRFHFIQAYKYNHLVFVVIPILICICIILIKKECRLSKNNSSK